MNCEDIRIGRNVQTDLPAQGQNNFLKKVWKPFMNFLLKIEKSDDSMI